MGVAGSCAISPSRSEPNMTGWTSDRLQHVIYAHSPDLANAPPYTVGSVAALIFAGFSSPP